MEDELKKAEHLSNKDPERAMELLSAIGVYLSIISYKLITRLSINDKQLNVIVAYRSYTSCERCSVKEKFYIETKKLLLVNN